jgi:aminoglycoside phosphotransferase (APT) family kinase protein
MTLPEDAPACLATWLASEVDQSVQSVRLTRFGGGHSGGAWRVDIKASEGEGTPLVLKAPEQPSVIFQQDAVREGRILAALSDMGAPVPAVVGIDSSSSVLSRASFLMEYIEGRSVDDSSPAGYHDDAWLSDVDADDQRALWNSFHDALAALHRVDPSKVPDASLGIHGVADVLHYWRDALLDAAPGDAVPRQLAVLDWLGTHLPSDADDEPAVCMGDARLVNSLIVGTEVRALIDFEVAYIGNPAADIGYSLFLDAQQRTNTEHALAGIPSDEQTWERWGRLTGRPTDRRAYWTAFGVTVIAITATRAMIQWGFAQPSDVEALNPLIAAWESAAELAAAD